MASCIITVVSLAFILSLRMNHKWAIFKPETERDKSITAFAWAHLRVSPNLFLYIYIYIFFFLEGITWIFIIKLAEISCKYR